MTKPLAAMAALGALAALAEIPEVTSAGIPLFRRDASSVQMLLNGTIKAGATNADGRTVITAGSDPAKAIAAAGAEWSGIASALINFLPAQATTLNNDPSDGNFVLTIQDTPANRSVVGSFLAITLYRFSADGTITDSDIVFNPSAVSSGVFYPLSTDHTNGSYDLQSLVAHELGHALGSSHSPVISATMFQSQGSFSAFNTVTEVTLHQALSADDVAFAATRYPVPKFDALALGSIAGKVAFSSGGAVVGALVVAVEPDFGTTIGGLASLNDGSYRLDSIPSGRYLVYAQPANGPVGKANLSGVPSVNLANTNFRATFLGGNATPSAVPVTVGRGITADILVDPATPGMQVAFLGTGSAGGTDYTFIVGCPKATAAGRALDLLLWGPGLDSTVTADQIRLIGPGITMRPGTLRTQASAAAQGFTPLRFTVDVAPAAATVAVTVAVVKGTDAAVYTGGFVIAGSTAACTYSVSSKQFSVPAAGGQGTVTVTAGTGCAWTAASDAPWLKIASTTAVSGNGSVSFAADPNVSAAGRSAALTIAGQTVVVDQSGATGGTPPVISSVVNGASFQTGIEAGSWVTIQGANLANTNPGRTWRGDEIVGGKLPTALDGVSVTINGKPASVYYISPAQINVQAPTDAVTGAVSVVVTNNGWLSAPATAQLETFAPAFFLYGGTSYAIVTRYPDNALVANPAALPGTVAAAGGDVLILWATGFGPTNPTTAAGAVVSGAPPVATLPAVTVGETPVTVIGAALSPGSAGLYQIAIQLPASLPSGNAAIHASVGGFTSPAGVNLFVK
jgi:uncharacterized protein (TIGR03437 family)